MGFFVRQIGSQREIGGLICPTGSIPSWVYEPDRVAVKKAPHQLMMMVTNTATAAATETATGVKNAKTANTAAIATACTAGPAVMTIPTGVTTVMVAVFQSAIHAPVNATSMSRSPIA